MDKEIKNYEITFLAKSEGDKEELINNLKRHELTILGDGPMSKTKLAYPIKKETFAYCGTLYFSGEADKIEELVKELKVQGKLLRFNIIFRPAGEGKMDIIKPASSEKERPVLERKEMEKSAADLSIRQTPKAPRIKTETLSNEALEKKLEEILK